jgi:hypothetical protein
MGMDTALGIYAAAAVLLVVPFGLALRSAGGRRAEQIIGAVVAALTWPLALPMLARSTARTRADRAVVQLLHPAGTGLEKPLPVASAQ